MMRSLYSGVAGLQNHQTRLDVIGNNVANVNTIGYKKNRVNFQDMLYQGMQGASRPTDELGGTNPKQVGLGMTVATIDTVHTQGALQGTGNKSDVAITGDGFFILKQGNQTSYTRAGAFNVDGDGNLVNPANGMKVQGWSANMVNGTMQVNPSGDIDDIKVPIYSKTPAKPTENVRMMCNLNKNTAGIDENSTPNDITSNTWVVDKKIYDTFGNEQNLRIEYTRDPATPNQWRGRAFVNPTADNPNPSNMGLSVAGQPVGADTEFTMNFDNTGSLTGITAGGQTINTGELSVRIGYDIPEANAGADGAAARQEFNLVVGTVGSFENSTTQTASTSSNKSYAQDGYAMGYLTAFNIDNSGTINATFTNGTTQVIGQLALATFTNPSGLEKSGETNFVETTNSGNALIDPASTAGKGKINAGTLEMSNVDLSAEFVDMIVTQRGFQANSKGIQTSDTMLQEILQLKR